MDMPNPSLVNTVAGLNRFVNLPVKLTKRLSLEELFAIVLNESVELTNCDGATLYMPEGDSLTFQHMITRSKKWELTRSTGASELKPVPMEKKFVCAYAAMSGKPINIMDVYEAREYDFAGTYQYDQMNSYRTKSMLVAPMMTEESGLCGVIQLINAMDEDGNIVPFVTKHVQIMMAIGALAALKMDDMKLRGEL